MSDDCGCDKKEFHSYAAGFANMALVSEYTAKVYGPPVVRQRQDGTMTWHQEETKYCLYCPCPKKDSGECPKGTEPTDKCCWLPCEKSWHDTGLLANVPVMSIPYPPNPPEPPVAWNTASSGAGMPAVEVVVRPLSPSRTHGSH